MVMQTLQNNQAYVGLFLALLVIIFVWWLIGLKVKREVRKYGKEQIRNPEEQISKPEGGGVGGRETRETIVNTTGSTDAVQGNNEQRGGLQDNTVKELEQYLGDTVEPSGSNDREQQASESSGETNQLPNETDSIPEPAEFEEI